jgi:hypothetical protein
MHKIHAEKKGTKLKYLLWNPEPPVNEGEALKTLKRNRTCHKIPHTGTRGEIRKNSLGVEVRI